MPKAAESTRKKPGSAVQNPNTSARATSAQPRPKMNGQMLDDGKTTDDAGTVDELRVRVVLGAGAHPSTTRGSNRPGRGRAARSRQHHGAGQLVAQEAVDQRGTIAPKMPRKIRK
jgi:hypothetical protein